MLYELPLGTRINIWWIVLCETWKLAVVATLPLTAREEYVRRHVSENFEAADACGGAPSERWAEAV